MDFIRGKNGNWGNFPLPGEDVSGWHEGAEAWGGGRALSIGASLRRQSGRGLPPSCLACHLGHSMAGFVLSFHCIPHHGQLVPAYSCDFLSPGAEVQALHQLLSKQRLVPGTSSHGPLGSACQALSIPVHPGHCPASWFQLTSHCLRPAFPDFPHETKAPNFRLMTPACHLCGNYQKYKLVLSDTSLNLFLPSLLVPWEEKLFYCCIPCT